MRMSSAEAGPINTTALSPASPTTSHRPHLPHTHVISLHRTPEPTFRAALPFTCLCLAFSLLSDTAHKCLPCALFPCIADKLLPQDICTCRCPAECPPHHLPKSHGISTDRGRRQPTCPWAVGNLSPCPQPGAQVSLRPAPSQSVCTDPQHSSLPRLTQVPTLAIYTERWAARSQVFCTPWLLCSLLPSGGGVHSLSTGAGGPPHSPFPLCNYTLIPGATVAASPPLGRSPVACGLMSPQGSMFLSL